MTNREPGYYWLKTKGEEPVLAHYYKNPDTNSFGFGFNTSDGGGFLPIWDLKEESELVGPIDLNGNYTITATVMVGAISASLDMSYPVKPSAKEILEITEELHRVLNEVKK